MEKLCARFGICSAVVFHDGMDLRRSVLSAAVQHAFSETTCDLGLPGLQFAQQSWDREFAAVARAFSA
eukprot:5534244-Lingulodinium_polyedra.AAC.1